jgi:hypothetical protein
MTRRHVQRVLAALIVAAALAVWVQGLARSRRRARRISTRSSRCHLVVRRRVWRTGIPTSPVNGFPTAPGRACRVATASIRQRFQQFDRKLTPEEPPQFRPEALAKIKSMTATELELSKSSVNCMPRGVPAIWLQNPYTTFIVHKPGLLAQLYEVLNNWRLIHTDGRPLPKSPEPFFHGNSTTRWEGDTLVVESIGFDERTYIMPNGWYHSDELKVTERYTRPSMNYLIVEITVDDPKVLLKPWKSAPRRWTLGNGEIYEFYCTNNLELEELEKLRQQELQQKK